mmetsp:Transcript_15579/g.30169  ORF Transcript_15579/g.30169 Transcript_15579/m.30169 type:complete len:1061 (-) Transcript_15579:276-3458(-)
MTRLEASGASTSMDTGSWNYESVPPPRVRGIQCCSCRPKPEIRKATSGAPIWDTADLTWWDLQRRRWSTLWLMKSIYYRTKQVDADTAGKETGDPDYDGPWNDIHDRNAREMREHAEQVKGLFIKAGQVMSSMIGILPDQYTQEFLLLTDHLPVSTINEVFRTIRQDLKRPPRDLFSSFDPEPIASASIAQVHRARLRSTGEVVAVKVQHEGVDRVFLDDVATLSVVASQLAFWAPDLDFTKFVEEWDESLPRELDFHEERRALERAGAVLRKAGNRTIVPRVFQGLVGQHVLVMEFIKADPIMCLQDSGYCAQHGVDKHIVLETLLDAFGIMAFKDGMFHCDPHAGNVRLIIDKNCPGGAAPVLFDWGLFREITDDERICMAKVFHSLANFDVSGFFDILQVLGFHIRPELMSDEFRRELLDRARGVMKDTVNRETTRANVKFEMAEYRERLRRAELEGSNLKGSYSPLFFLEEFPSCIIFFMRMLNILRGLCGAVNAEGMPILQIFSRHAKEALLEGSQKQALASSVRLFAGREPQRSSRRIEEEDLLTDQGNVRQASLEVRIGQMAKSFIAAQRAVGVQVVVIQGGQMICDINAGTLSTTDARPVQTSTHFPLMGATAGLAALATLRALHRLADAQKLALSTEEVLRMPIVQLWPDFSGGSSTLTVADILSHQAGMQSAFPRRFTPKQLDDVASMVQHFEQVSLPCAQETRYNYLLQAFIMSKLGDCITGNDNLLHWLDAELGALGLDIAAPAGRGEEASVCRDVPNLSRISMTEVAQGHVRRKTSAIFGVDCRDHSESNTQTLLESIAKDPLVFDPLQANSTSGALFRGGLSLGASAKGLATLLSSEGLQQNLTAMGALEAADMDPTAVGWMLTGGACLWTRGGLQLLELQGSGRRALIASRQGGYGIVCGFGPCVVHFPSIAAGGVTVAVMVNDVLRGREVVRDLITEVLAGYGYVPAWTAMPMRVLVDAGRLTRSKELEPLLDSVGGLRNIIGGLSMEGGTENAPYTGKRGQARRGSQSGCMAYIGRCCMSLCCCAKYAGKRSMKVPATEHLAR